MYLVKHIPTLQMGRVTLSAPPRFLDRRRADARGCTDQQVFPGRLPARRAAVACTVGGSRPAVHDLRARGARVHDAAGGPVGPD